MKVLKISNMYPSKQKAYAGIFVKNQYEELKRIFEEGEVLDIFYMRRAFTSKIGSIVKYGVTFLRFIPFYFKKYDIVHVHYFYPLILLAWIKKKIHPNTKIVVTFLGRDINMQVNEKNVGFYRKIAKAIDFSIPVGKTMAKEVERKLHLHNHKILPCGVNSEIFYKEEKEKIYDFIFIGSFIHRKGIDTVIKAIKLLPTDSKIKFCFCGSGEYLEQLNELKTDYDITIMENQTQDQLRTLLNSSKFFLLMSRGEGFATATTEAFFCGVPVLTSDIENFKEQVNIGSNGFIVELENEKELHEKLTELTEINQKEYQKLSEGALSSFPEASLENVCLEIYRIYKNLKIVV